MKPVRPSFLAFGRPAFGDAEIAAVTKALRSGWVGMGPEVIAFEQELAEFFQVPHVVTVSSCTAALHLSLVAHGVGPGDEVICPSLTWCSTANAAMYVGAKPILCDVDPYTLSVSPETIAAKITSRTRAVIVVHFGGLALDIARLRETLPGDIAIVEDAAHALGAKFPNGKPVGCSGNLTCFSFYANKNLSTAEGGAVALADGDMAERLRSLRQHGLTSDAWQRFTHSSSLSSPAILELGYKANYTDLQASIGRIQLKRQPEFHAKRQSVARHYVDALDNCISGLRFQRDITSDAHARHLAVLVLPLEQLRAKRDQILAELRARNIGATIHYKPLHWFAPYRGEDSAVPVTSELTDRLLTLPIGASMSDEDVTYVVEHTLDVLDKARVSTSLSAS
jgi:dTDP-4-amino-4,6-dideoxygalactose transaminase